MDSKLVFLCFFVAAVVITGAAVVPNDNVEVILAEVESLPPPGPEERQLQPVQVGQSVMTSLQSVGNFAVGVFRAFFAGSVISAVVLPFLALLWMFKAVFASTKLEILEWAGHWMGYDMNMENHVERFFTDEDFQRRMLDVLDSINQEEGPYGFIDAISVLNGDVPSETKK